MTLGVGSGEVGGVAIGSVSSAAIALDACASRTVNDGNRNGCSPDVSCTLTMASGSSCSGRWSGATPPRRAAALLCARAARQSQATCIIHRDFIYIM